MSSLSLSRAGKAYVWIVVAGGGVIILSALIRLDLGLSTPYWLGLAALTLFSGPFSIRVPSICATISVSEAFVFALALLFGPAPATVTVALDGFLVSRWARHRNIHHMLFNTAEPAISVWLSAQLFYGLAGVEPLFGQSLSIEPLLVPLLVMTTSYFLLNASLTTTAVWFETRVSPAQFLRSQVSYLSLNYFVSLCLVVLLAHNADDLTFAAVGVIVPLLVVSYASSRTSMARVEEGNLHLAELNRLYLSTIEAFAAAIDAKDQITHGHIRRVQCHTVALAKSLRVKDETQLKAIETAALLHDLGKLAVPEHILNKPGKLTPAEFENMKAHANVGANILSAIEFPYPVTPIVRHHHEWWDGHGYPDGLAGEAIPIGARILSVVDCFDALTSDRPYRRKLTKQEAFDILRSKRGSMYDPIVVDRFVETFDTMPDPADDVGAEHRLARLGLPLLTTAQPIAAPPGTPAPGDPVRPPDRHTHLEATGQTITHCLGTVAPTAIVVLYRYDPSTLQLTSAYVSSTRHQFLRDIAMPLGDRLSGWVGANRQTIVNSDPTLDLVDLADACTPRLESCLSTPLVWEDSLVGVLTLYAPGTQAFSAEQTRIVELLAGGGANPGAGRPPASGPPVSPDRDRRQPPGTARAGGRRPRRAAGGRPGTVTRFPSRIAIPPPRLAHPGGAAETGAAPCTSLPWPPTRAAAPPAPNRRAGSRP